MQKNQQKTIKKKFNLPSKGSFNYFHEIQYILKWTLICLIIGSFIGSASAVFLLSLDWATNVRENNVWLIVLLPIGGILIGFLYHYLGKNIETGNNLLIETIHEPKQRIPFRMAPFVYLGTITTHFFGGSAGREGTALQMSGAIADQFSKPFQLSKSDRSILIVAAISAGFGSVFGTPLAGAIFGLEIFLIGKIKYNAILPAFAAAIIADLVTKLWQTPHTHYEIQFVPDSSFLNLMYAVIAGIAFGLCAKLFVKMMHKVTYLFKSKIAYPPLRPFVGGVIIALAVGVIGTTKFVGLGIPIILESFTIQLPSYDFAIKILFTVVTLSAGFKGGEVTPLFFIGATLGNALSLFIPLPIGLLAGMGFVAVFAGATNTPIACSIMAIELFGAECGVYVATACIVSYLLSGHNSIYSSQVIGEPKHKRYTHHQGKKMTEIVED